MKILFKLLTFSIFTLVLCMPGKYDTSKGELINNCDEIKKLSQEPKEGEDTTITKCDCSLDKDDMKGCYSSSELSPIHKSTLDKRKGFAEPTRNSVYFDITQTVVPDLTSTVTDTVAELNYSEGCTTTRKNIGEITSDETVNTMTSCCGIEASSGNKIYGGTETAIDEFPWLAMLEYERSFLCGGTLISSFYVLTAAHCLVAETMKPRGVKSVRLGEHDTNNDGEDCVEAEGGGMDCTDGAISIAISNTIVHPEYNNVNTIILQANDIGLLRLNKSSPYTDFIRPICLPAIDVTRVAPSLDIRFHVAGWGAVSYYQQRSDVKLQVDLPIIDQKVCEKLYSIKGKPLVWDKQICAGGEPNKDTCKGDSGGPLIYSDDDSKIHQVIGITSFGTLRCGSQGRPSIYTKVIEYVPWILANMKPL